MQLVDALAAGVRGAENGHAELYLRGSSTRATWYASFEGDGANSTGANIQLDSFGGATVYVASLCDVIIKNSLGTTVRELVAGARDDTVEVVSPSFTGTHYTTGQVAANQPTTLASVLDSWLTSAGATDWNVLQGGSSITLQQAVAGNVYVNVKVAPFSAVGDGVTDDTASINAAILAAEALGGATVFFPPGTYLVSAAVEVKENVGLLGSGAAQTFIQRSTSSFTLLNFENVASAEYNVSHLTLEDNVTGTNQPILTLPVACDMFVDHCVITDVNGDGTNSLVLSASPGLSTFRWTRIVLRGTGGSIGTGSEVRMLNCDVTWAGTDAFALSGLTGAIQVIGCVFDVAVDAADVPLTGLLNASQPSIIVGNIFKTGVTLPDTVIAIAANASSTTDNFIVEDANQMEDAFRVVSTGGGLLTGRSRDMRYRTQTIAAPGVVTISPEFGVNVVTTTGAVGTYTMAYSTTAKSRSAVMHLIIRNTSANAHTIDFTGTNPADAGVALPAGQALRVTHLLTTAGATTGWIRMVGFTVGAL